MPFHTVSTTLSLAREAERHEYSSFGIAEGWSYDAFVLLTQVASLTSRIELGTGVVSVWSRTPAAIAMAAAALQNVSQGRFVLGLGASSKPLVEGLHGTRWSDPVGRLRRGVTVVHELLEGRRSPEVAGDARPMRLDSPPVQRIPIMVAALAPPSVRLAGELADVWMPFLWALPKLSGGRALLREGEAVAADPRPTLLRAAVPVALAEDAAAARALAAAWLVLYLTKMGPLYPTLLRERFGYGKEMDVLLEVNAGDRPPVLPAKAERLARDLTLMGTFDEGSQIVDEWLRGGADAVTLVLPPWEEESRLTEAIAAAGGSRGGGEGA